jgi:predicted PurR-regulated permease PerM
VIVAVVAAGFGLYFGREFFQPIAIALLLMAVFRPPVRAMERLRVPAPLGAGIVVLGLLAAITGIGFALAPAVQKWIQHAPETASAAEAKLARIRKPVQQVQDVAKKFEQAAQGSSTTSGTSAPSTTTSPSTPPTSAPSSDSATAGSSSGGARSGGGSSAPAPALPAPAEPPTPTWLATAFGTTTQFFSGAIEVILLLFLLLATGDLFTRKLIRITPGRDDKAEARKIIDDVEDAVKRYLLVTLAINLGQGAIIWLVMWMLKMPHPLLWGVATVVLEFVPYLGAVVMMVLLTISAVATFDSVGRILAPPAAYLLVTTIQNNIVSPLAYGNGLKLNPVAVLLGVILWWFLWGIPGAFVAVPILAVIKIVSDRGESLKPVGELLGE